MKNKFTTLSAFVALFIGVVSCGQATKAPLSAEGLVFDATMNNVTIVTTTGDTLNICTMDANADSVKVAGVLVDDSVMVSYTETTVDGNTILNVNELTVTKHAPSFFISGSWVELNPIDSTQVQGMTLNSDGTAASINMATLLVEKWNMENGNLILSTKSIGNKETIESIDTMKIIKLDADSLVLDRGTATWTLSRQK